MQTHGTGLGQATCYFVSSYVIYQIKNFEYRQLTTIGGVFFSPIGVYSLYALVAK